MRYLSSIRQSVTYCRLRSYDRKNLARFDSKGLSDPYPVQMYPQGADFDVKRPIPVRSCQKRQKSKGNEGLHWKSFHSRGIQGAPFQLAPKSAKKKREKKGARL